MITKHYALLTVLTLLTLSFPALALQSSFEGSGFPQTVQPMIYSGQVEVYYGPAVDEIRSSGATFSNSLQTNQTWSYPQSQAWPQSSAVGSPIYSDSVPQLQNGTAVYDSQPVEGTIVKSSPQSELQNGSQPQEQSSLVENQPVGGSVQGGNIAPGSVIFKDGIYQSTDIGYEGPGDMRNHLWNDHKEDLGKEGIDQDTLMSMPMQKVQKWHNFFHGTEGKPE